MNSYLKSNLKSWSEKYDAPNVESVIFRLHGRILKNELNLPKKKTVLLDFGCGQGASTNFFYKQGYDVYGIDISQVNINIAKKRYPKLKNRFKICKPDVFNQNLKVFCNKKKISVIICQQSLYYFDKADFFKLLDQMKNSMSQGGVIYASMISKKHTYFKHSRLVKGSKWLREILFKGRRLKKKKIFEFFVNDEKHLRKLFNKFKILNIGSYHLSLEAKESNNHHFIVVAQKI